MSFLILGIAAQYQEGKISVGACDSFADIIKPLLVTGELSSMFTTAHKDGCIIQCNMFNKQLEIRDTTPTSLM
ncbi:hypothetical protein B9J82_15675 [Vibrio sp. V10_P2A27P122]|nr:hypothetical protein B9J82_15675 [Vibrio sp. V10_P2A27P122]